MLTFQNSNFLYSIYSIRYFYINILSTFYFFCTNGQYAYRLGPKCHSSVVPFTECVVCVFLVTVKPYAMFWSSRCLFVFPWFVWSGLLVPCLLTWGTRAAGRHHRGKVLPLFLASSLLDPPNLSLSLLASASMTDIAWYG